MYVLTKSCSVWVLARTTFTTTGAFSAAAVEGILPSFHVSCRARRGLAAEQWCGNMKDANMPRYLPRDRDL